MTQAAPTQETKDVSLGPACLVVVVFGLVLASVAVIYMSASLMGSQGRRAAHSLRRQLIPWVELSSLTKADRDSIVEQLSDLANNMDREELTARQLTRLGLRLQGNPIFQWGVVEQINRVAQSSTGLTPREKEEFARECDRWLRSASDGKLSMQQMEFALQNVAVKEVRSGRLTVREQVTDDGLREFLRRISSIDDSLEVGKDPFEKSVSQILRAMIEDGLKEK